MKQHITESQLNELSEKGRDRLVEWCRHQDIFLSIGQMIEFLDEHPEEFYDEWWQRFFRWDYGEVNKEYDGEICDALWQACKEILND